MQLTKNPDIRVRDTQTDNPKRVVKHGDVWGKAWCDLETVIDSKGNTHFNLKEVCTTP